MNHPKNKCIAKDPKEMSEKLRLFFQGELQGEMQDAVQKHLLACPHCSAETISLQVPAPQEDRNRYEILDVLGKGGSAIVFKVKDVLENRTIALKVFHEGADAKVLGENTRHVEMQNEKIAGVVKFLGMDQVQIGEEQVTQTALLFEYQPHGSLKDKIESWAANPQELDDQKSNIEKLRFLIELTEIVLALHSHEIVHMDLNPSNILWGEQDQPIICDFGTSMSKNQLLDGRYLGEGTLKYASPEQQLEKLLPSVGTQSDVWAMGQIISEVMGGSVQETTRDSDTNEITGVNFWPIKLNVEPVADELNLIIRQCLRMPNAVELRPLPSELRNKLEEVKKRLEAKPPVPPPVPPDKLPIVFAVLVAIIALLIYTPKIISLFQESTSSPDVTAGANVDPNDSSTSSTSSGEKQVASNGDGDNRALQTPAVLIRGWPKTVKAGQNFTLRIDESSESPIATCSIEQGGSLSVQGSGTVLWPNKTGILSKGHLEVVAEEGKQLLFTGTQSKQWNGILLYGEGTSGSKLKRLNITRGEGFRSKKIGDSRGELATFELLTDSDEGKRFGGGLAIINSNNIEISDCVVQDCQSEGGGATFLYGVTNSTRFNKVKFVDNIATGDSLAVPGGAVFLQHCKDVAFEECSFLRNRAVSNHSCGGAIYVGVNNWLVSLKKCRFKNNMTTKVGGAIYTYCNGAHFDKDSKLPNLEIFDCRFEDNYTEFWKWTTNKNNHSYIGGSELFVNDGTRVKVADTTFTNNFSPFPLFSADGKEGLLVEVDTENVGFHSRLNQPHCLPERNPNDSSLDSFVEHSPRDSFATELISSPAIMEIPLPRNCFREHHGRREIDTVVMHFASAVNWTTASDDQFTRLYKKTFVQGLRGGNKLTQREIDFDPRFVRAIFEAYGVGAHFMIDRKGTIFQLVNVDDVAYHAGKGKMPKQYDPSEREGINGFSIGIELIAAEDAAVSKSPNLALGMDKQSGARAVYTIPQYYAANYLLRYLTEKGYDLRHIVGHDEIAPDRKQDPGPNFAWGAVREEDGSPAIPSLPN